MTDRRSHTCLGQNETINRNEITHTDTDQNETIT